MRIGYVSIHRQLQDSGLWLGEPFTRGQAWVDLIMLANFKDSSFRIRGVKISVSRGQLAHSILTLADRWRWSRGKVTRFLNELETEQQIEQQKSKLTTLITIVNYDIYQNIDTTNDTTDGQQTDNKRTYKNNINNNNNNKAPSVTSPILLKTFLQNCKENGEKPIPENHAVFTYAEKTGIPIEWLRLCWDKFQSKYVNDTKKYKDWRKAFLNCIKDNWFKFWAINSEGEIFLTTQGKLAEKEFGDKL